MTTPPERGLPRCTNVSPQPSTDARLTPGGNAQRLQLAPQEITDILAFMNTLAGQTVTTDARWSTPFEPNGTLLSEGFNTSVAGWMVF